MAIVIHGGPLPGGLASVAEVVGSAAALSLAREFGGLELYIPENVPEGHPLARALGLAPARAVAKLLGRGDFVIPLGPAGASRPRETAQAIKRLLREHKSDTQIWAALKAEGLHCHIETIRRHRRRAVRMGGRPGSFVVMDGAW